MDYLRNLSRCFIHQCVAAGYILCADHFGTAATTIQGAYAKLEPTFKGRDVLISQQAVLLPQLNVSNENCKHQYVIQLQPRAQE